MKIRELLSDLQKSHSQFQIDHFILGKCSTPFGTYMQALREMYSRVASIVSTKAEIALLDLEIEELGDLVIGDSVEFCKRKILEEKRDKHRLDSDQRSEIEIRLLNLPSKADEERNNQRLGIKLQAAKFGRSQLQHTLEDTYREFKAFYVVASSLKPHFENLDELTRYKLDAENWQVTARNKAVFDLVVSGRVSPQSWELIASLPTDQKEELEKELRNADTMNLAKRLFEPTTQDVVGKLKCNIPSLESITDGDISESRSSVSTSQRCFENSKLLADNS